MWSKCRLVVWLSLTALFGCGDGSVSVCFGDVVFCNQAFKPFANAGPDQTVTPGAVVTLDGSNSVGNIREYSWAQTGGPSVALADANTLRATFVAPDVAVAATLTFRLTVVDSLNKADTASTNVAVLPPAAAALSRAIELLEGPQQPTQTARMLVAARPAPTQDTAGQIESFGFSLLGALASQRDPALHEAVAERLAGASMLADPAGLLSGRTDLRHRDEIVFEYVPDPAVTNVL